MLLKENVIRKATLSDINRILTIIGEIVFEGNPYDLNRWDETYPNRELIEEDIADEAMFVLTQDNEIIAFITLDEKYTIDFGDFQWPSGHVKSILFHRLAVKPSYQGKGFGKRLMDYSERYALSEGYEYVRFSVVAENYIAIDLYEKKGYTKVGSSSFLKHDITFIYYEKNLKL